VDLNNNVYDTLVELDPTKPGELVPGLAESWSVADDGVTYTFKMKPGHHLFFGQSADGGRCGLFAAARGQAEQDRRPSS
jgi:ABC-type oligopeptide transport system substrate-binding subunit